MAKAFGKHTEIYLSDKCVPKLAERLYAVLKTSIRRRVQIPTKHIISVINLTTKLHAETRALWYDNHCLD